MLLLAAGVGEPQIGELRLFFLDEFDDIGRIHIACLPAKTSYVLAGPGSIAVRMPTAVQLISSRDSGSCQNTVRPATPRCTSILRAEPRCPVCTPTHAGPCPAAGRAAAERGASLYSRARVQSRIDEIPRSAPSRRRSKSSCSRCRPTGRSAAAWCCSLTTWRSGPAPSTPRPSCAPSDRSPGRPRTCSPRAARPTGATATTRFACSTTTSFRWCIKPSPLDMQELYLDSLRALGFDPLVHDMRFVEDNWESPTLGAWGLGWEVWLNGMEITQFTYFQQVGGLDCRPVTGEITYGLERLAMYLQNVESIFDILWTRRPARARDLRRRVPSERGRAVALQLRARGHRACCGGTSRTTSAPAANCSRRSWRCPPTSRRCAPRTPSICSMREARSRSPSARASCCGCAHWRAAVAQAYFEARAALGFPLLRRPEGEPTA